MTIIQSITSPVPLFPCQLWDEASIIIRVPLWDWSKPFSLYYWYIANLCGSDFLSFPPSPLPCQVFLGLLLLFSCCVPTCVSLFATLWSAARQAPLTMGFPRTYWSGLPFPPPSYLPNSGIKHKFPALAGGFFTTESPGKWQKSLLHKHSPQYLLLGTHPKTDSFKSKSILK